MCPLDPNLFPFTGHRSALLLLLDQTTAATMAAISTSVASALSSILFKHPKEVVSLSLFLSLPPPSFSSSACLRRISSCRSLSPSVAPRSLEMEGKPLRFCSWSSVAWRSSSSSFLPEYRGQPLPSPSLPPPSLPSLMIDVLLQRWR